MNPRRDRTLVAIALATTFFLGACAGPTGPVRLDTKNDACASCRMPVSDPHLAAQVTAPNEDPLFFDDLACLRTWLQTHPAAPANTRSYVADHTTTEWVPLSGAQLTRTKAVQTPMGSGLVAHLTEASRAADAATVGGDRVDPATFLPIVAARTLPAERGR